MPIVVVGTSGAAALSLKKGEAELERRTGKRPKREEVLERVTAAYEGSQDRQSLLDALGREGLELYVRGNNLGVVDLESGKNHRLKTLDLEMADRVAIRMEGGELADEVKQDDPELDPVEAKAEPQEKQRLRVKKKKSRAVRLVRKPRPSESREIGGDRRRRYSKRLRKRGPESRLSRSLIMKFMLKTEMLT